MNLLQEGWVWWAAGIAVGLPVLLVILTEIVAVLARRGHPAAGPVRFLRNWVLPVAGVFALMIFAFRSPADQVWVRVVATLLGFLVILLVLSSFNVALFARAESGSWRERIPTIFVEIARLILVVVGLAILFQWVWGADVGGLIAALGVGSIVIGLALQNAVGGVISGLLLLFEQPFRIGDWLSVGGTAGKVVEVNWRAVHLDTGAGIQIIPNSSLSGASFTNLSQPVGSYIVATDVKFTTDDPPHEVISLLVTVADALPMKVASERPSAEYSGNGSYRVSFAVERPGLREHALSLYLAWLWYAARRQHLALDGDATDPIAEPHHLEAAVATVSPTLHLRNEDGDTVRSASHLERYGAGEVVLPTGVVPDHMWFVVSGSVRLAVETSAGRIEFATVERGDYIGQSALTREKTIVTAVAGEVVTLLSVPLATLDAIVSKRPKLAAEIGASMELKRKSAAEALANAGIVRSGLALGN
ncbi:mechanosensitive ion channel domain-containing protein [Microbacterium sp. NPDC091382]|uniref:mechanosensitive ion channel domain-containing protein n=1 Tax=Microbacterium sp. NPDC091382 TaxID=3364210 RepID=UPI0037F95DC0